MSTAREKGKGKGNNKQGKGDYMMEDTREEINKQEHYNQPTDTSKQEIQRTAKGWQARRGILRQGVSRQQSSADL